MACSFIHLKAYFSPLPFVFKGIYINAKEERIPTKAPLKTEEFNDLSAYIYHWPYNNYHKHVGHKVANDCNWSCHSNGGIPNRNVTLKSWEKNKVIRKEYIGLLIALLNVSSSACQVPLLPIY